MQASWMLVASLLFAMMGVCVKVAAQWYTSWEILLWRGVVSTVFIAALASWKRVPLATPVPAMHLWRSLVGVASLGSWFYALAYLPLATAMTLNYMSSVWIAVFIVGGAMLMSRDGAARQGPLVLTVLAGFVGVVLMLRPTIEQNQALAGVVGLLSGMMAALAYMQVMTLSRIGEPDTRTVFYFALATTAVGVVAVALTGMSDWSWARAPWLLAVGLLASVGQLCMTRAYARGSTLVVANLQYSGIVFAAIFGMVLFGDLIPLYGWLGMGLIVASGIAATILRERAAPHSPGEEH